MIDKAIAKITEEMMELSHPFAVFIEEYLASICTNDKVAMRILAPEKTLKEFVKTTIEEFKEKAKAGGGGLQVAGAPDAEFFCRADKYFGISEEDKQGCGRSVPPTVDVVDILDFL